MGSERPSFVRSAIELALFLLVLLLPLVAVWAASSLAAFWSGQQAIAAALGLLFFPVLPVSWELYASWRRKKQKTPRPRQLTLIDRLTLRTLVVTLPFLLTMLLSWPAPLFQALTTRGDWFLESVDAPWARAARANVLRVADGLVWMYDAVHDNPWRDDGGHEVVTDGTHPPPMPTHDDIVVQSTMPHPDVAPTPPAPPATQWPFDDTLHPLAHAPPAAALASIDALGAYYAAQITDPTERAKAVHDYVADHIAYDVASYRAHAIPPQTAEITFTTHIAVCAGYARLFEALGRAAGLEVEYVTGDARNSVGESESHAWNAIHLNDRWELVDTTWDAGTVGDDGFHPGYRSTHFLAPPEAMIVTHFPDDTRWQLRDTLVTRGEWNRQPMMRAAFFADGFRMLAPDRGQLDGGPSITARVASDRGWSMLASVEPHDGGERTACDVAGASAIEIACQLPSHGGWTVHLYGNPLPWGTFDEVASFEVSYR